LGDLRKAIGGLRTLSFRPAINDPDEIEVVAEFEDDRLSVPAAQLSDGARSLLGLLALLYSPRTFKTVCLEEPESGLTPQSIDVFAEALMNLASSNDSPQFVITTHSPFLRARAKIT
jgi:predicted ATPase